MPCHSSWHTNTPTPVPRFSGRGCPHLDGYAVAAEVAETLDPCTLKVWDWIIMPLLLPAPVLEEIPAPRARHSVDTGAG